MGTGKIAILGLFAILANGRTLAAPMTFDYKDPKEISAVSLSLDSKLEPIVGYAKGISGSVVFDPENPKATTGKIAVEVASVQFANEGYTATARNFALNGDKYPRITFTLRKILSGTRISKNIYKGMISADFVCKGITLPLIVPVTASYYPGLAEERTNGKYRGDVMVLRTNFAISRKKLGISEGIPDSLVGDTIQVGVAVVGLHYAPGQNIPEQKLPETSGKSTESPAQKKETITQKLETPVTRQEVPVDNKLNNKRNNKTASRWKMEIENRDEPISIDAEFDLASLPPSVTFETSKGAVHADHVSLTGSKMTFHLPDNPLVGTADGEAMFEKDTAHGALLTKDEKLKWHARQKCTTENLTANVEDHHNGNSMITMIPNVSQGPGFRDLTIETKGKKQSLAERLRFYRVPAVSIARFENYQVVEKGAFGVTNVETGIPVDNETMFQAGGMGSPLVNLLALRLAAVGQLDLNREANAYLKSGKIQDNAFTLTHKITVLDLVNGASGLSQQKFTGYPPTTSIPTLAALLAGTDSDEMEPLQAVRKPGTFGGEGICQAILEQVITDATGKPFAELMQRHIFTPFGMTHSTYDIQPIPTDENKSAKKIALGHYATGELMLDRFHIYPEAGASGLWTTASDFARMLCQIQLLLAGKPNLILAEAQHNLLESVITKQWILGLIKSEGKGLLSTDYMYHGGASYGYYANHATHISNGSGVVVMENRNLGWQLNNEIIRAVGKTHGWSVDQPERARIDQPVLLDISLPEIRKDQKVETLNLAQQKGRKNLVLFFFSEQCGVTFHYKQRLLRLQKEFENRGFAFVGVRCGKREKPEEPIALAEAQYLQMPFVDDATGVLTNVFRVRQSLTFAVIDKAGKLRYRGGFDNNVEEKRVTKSYLPNALHALAAGKPITMKEGFAIGCAILPYK